MSKFGKINDFIRGLTQEKQKQIEENRGMARQAMANESLLTRTALSRQKSANNQALIDKGIASLEGDRRQSAGLAVAEGRMSSNEYAGRYGGGQTGTGLSAGLTGAAGKKGSGAATSGPEEKDMIAAWKESYDPADPNSMNYEQFKAANFSGVADNKAGDKAPNAWQGWKSTANITATKRPDGKILFSDTPQPGAGTPITYNEGIQATRAKQPGAAAPGAGTPKGVMTKDSPMRARLKEEADRIRGVQNQPEAQPAAPSPQVGTVGLLNVPGGTGEAQAATTLTPAPQKVTSGGTQTPAPAPPAPLPRDTMTGIVEQAQRNQAASGQPAPNLNDAGLRVLGKGAQLYGQGLRGVANIGMTPANKVIDVANAALNIVTGPSRKITAEGKTMALDSLNDMYKTGREPKTQQEKRLMESVNMLTQGGGMSYQDAVTYLAEQLVTERNDARKGSPISNIRI